MSELSEIDAEAIAATIRILTEARLTVVETSETSRYDHGVEFELVCRAPTRTRGLASQLEAVKEAAIDAPEFGMNGNRLDGGEDE